MLLHQLTYGGPQNPPAVASYPPYSAPSAAGYGAVAAPAHYGAAPHPPAIGFNPSIVQGAAPCKML